MINNNIKLLQLFLDKIKDRYSIKTIINYKFNISKYLNWCPDINDIKHNKYDSIKNYSEYLLLNNYSIMTINYHLTSINLFYKLIFNNDRECPFLERPDRIINYHTKEEIISLFYACNNIKHRLVLMVAYGIGLSLKEICNLKKSNIDLDNKLIIINNRSIPIDKTTYDLLLHYLQSSYMPNDNLFVNKKGFPLHIRSIQKIYRKTCQLANIDLKNGIKSLRHSFAIHSLENGTDLRLVQKAMGLKNYYYTKIYNKSIKEKKIINPIDNLNLINNIKFYYKKGK